MKLTKQLEPKINRKIIKFFCENPSSVDTSRGIATWINENAGTTEKALNGLAKAKILIPHRTGMTSAYAYTTDARIISSIRIGLKKLKAGKRRDRKKS